jgi:hypothetical protein
VSQPVGIVIRARGGRLLLERALRSVAAQSHADWTAVVVGADLGDLGGEAADPRVTFLDLPGAGAAEAANAGLDALGAHAPAYVALHDDDATWHPSFLERALAHLEHHPTDAAVAVRAEVVVEARDADGVRELSREPLAQDDHEASLVASVWGSYLPVCSLVVRDDARRAVGGFDTALDALEDWDFVLRLLAHGRVGFLDAEPLAAWHHEPDLPDHSAAELRLRDRYVRRDLASGADGVSGLGAQLGLAHQLRGIGARNDAAWRELSRVTDTWGHAHQDQLDVVSTEVQLELGRLRGEMLLMREMLTDIEEDVTGLAERFETALAKNRRASEAMVRALVARLDEAEPSRPAPWTVRRVAGGVRRRVSSRLGRRSGTGSGEAPQAPGMLPGSGRSPNRDQDPRTV